MGHSQTESCSVDPETKDTGHTHVEGAECDIERMSERHRGRESKKREQRLSLEQNSATQKQQGGPTTGAGQ